MNRNHLWRFLIIVGLLLWSVYEMYPPQAQPLVPAFHEHAFHPDATIANIVKAAEEANKQKPDQEYDNLLTAIGTNDITKYFPELEPQKQAHPTTYILNQIQRAASGRIKLGIDLAGGTAFLVKLDTNKLVVIETKTNALNQVETTTNAPAERELSGALSQAVEVLRKRVDRFGVAEPVIQPEGSDRILIELPGLSESVKSNAMATLQKPAYLEFRMVNPQSDTLLKEGVIPPGYEVLNQVSVAQDGTRKTTPYLVRKRADMKGGIKRAFVVRGPVGQPEITFELDSEGATTFGRLTRENVGHALAIILDGELQTAPRIDEPIENGSGVIKGDYTETEAFSLANVLENPLKTPVSIISQNDVDPTLGKDSITSGIKASLYGIIAVATFMVVYYMLAGAVADVALVLNIIILVGVMCSIGTTFTLPGIAGLVLTIGMAVDANVLIFERIREESAKGKSMKGALQAGYDRAFGTIFDSHVTTLISSIILIWMGTGSVKGFGVSLTIGVAASLFTALVVTRLIFDFLINRNIVTQLRMLHLIPATMKINFMRLAWPAFIASWTLIAVGMSYGIFVRGNDVKGVEFAGGDTITLGFDQQHKIEVDKLRTAATKASSGEVLISYQHNISTSTDTLRVTVRAQSEKSGGAAGDVSTRVVGELKKDFPEANFRTLGTDHVGPIVGQEIEETAIIASLLAMFGILIYVALRYEFTFAVGAVIAIIHDVLMTLGCYFLAGRELNATTVAAVLTIIGFSINDTIVIFDRIREDLKMGVRGSFKDVINQALNQTLSRTIITSGTVFLATMSLFIFGGGPINDFAFTFLVGILTGTYSSIYIASAWVLMWQNWRHGGQRPKIGTAQLSVENAAAMPK